MTDHILKFRREEKKGSRHLMAVGRVPGKRKKKKGGSKLSCIFFSLILKVGHDGMRRELKGKEPRLSLGCGTLSHWDNC